MVAWADRAMIGPVVTFLPQSSRGFVTVHFRHLDVHENDVERFRRVVVSPAPAGERGQGHFHGFLPVPGDRHFGAGLFEHQGEQALIVAAILGQEDAAVERGPRRRRGGARHHRPRMPRERFAGHRSGGDRQPERAALVRLAGDGDVAAQQHRQAFADGQPQAGAAVLAAGRRVGLGEGLEDYGQLGGRHADARVGDVEL